MIEENVKILFSYAKIVIEGEDSIKDKKSLIIYFSRADENYAVGYVDKGNTEYVAEYVRDLTNADMFKVEPLFSYAKDYQICI